MKILTILFSLLFVSPVWADSLSQPQTLVFTKTQAFNTYRLSVVDGAAHVFVSTFTLADYASRALIDIKDAAGKHLKGYTGAAGTGETLVELINDPTFDAPASWITGAGWSVAGGKGVAAGATATALTNTPLAGQVNKLIFFTIVCDSYTGGSYFANTSVAVDGTFTSSGTKTGYVTVPSNSANALGLVSGAALTATFTDISMKRVDTPAVDGVLITSTLGGTTQNWASLDAGFQLNPNTATAYTLTLTYNRPMNIQTGLNW